MSKLYKEYLSLKSLPENKEVCLFFKSGIFFICLSSDATLISKVLGLKLTHFCNEALKCGFPISSSEKYFDMLNYKHISFRVVDLKEKISTSSDNYLCMEKMKNMLMEISSIEPSELSIREAYKLINDLKNKAKQLLSD